MATVVPDLQQRKVGIATKHGPMEFIIPLDQRKVNIKTDNQNEFISVLDVRFKSDINFLSYSPFPIHEPPGSVILGEWKREVQIMCHDLEQVLVMSSNSCIGLRILFHFSSPNTPISLHSHTEAPMPDLDILPYFIHDPPLCPGVADVTREVLGADDP